MNKQTLLKHLAEEVYCRLKPSSHGVGIIAIRDIPINTNPFSRCWDGDYHPVTHEELARLAPGVQEMVKAYCVFSEDVWYVPEIGLNGVDMSFFINHSQTPNVATEDGMNFSTLRPIKEGEELLVDYNTYSEGLSS